MSKQRVRNRDVREFRGGAGALRVLALLGALCCVFGMLAKIAGGRRKRASVEESRIRAAQG